MTPTEAAALLTIAATYDNRQPDVDKAKAWAMVLDGIRFEDARDAIVAHYMTSSDWLMPADLRASVKRLRDKRIADHPPLTPPADLSPAETNEWLRDRRRRVGDGEVFTDEQTRGELKPRHLPDLRALLPKPDTHPAPDDHPTTHPRADRPEKEHDMSSDLIKIREWIDSDEPVPEDGCWEWPAPPEYTEYRVEGQMRADVLAKVGRPTEDAATVRLIEGVIEGGYSEYTVEHDYPIEVWIDDEGQSQRVFDHEAYWRDDAMAAFLKWIAPTTGAQS